MNEAFREAMIARGVQIERGYLDIEKSTNPPPLDSAQIAHLNHSMGFELGKHNSKGHDYRPYCAARRCKDMPRMYRVKDGFKCWACDNHWDLSEHRIMPLMIVPQPDEQ